MTRSLCLVFWILLPVLTGCSDKVQFGGRVTFSDDGLPVEYGFVVFSTPTFQSRGAIGPDGTYVLSSTGNEDGIPPGEYAVFLGGTEKTVVVDENESPLYIPQVDGKYLSAETSGLRCTVDGNTKRYDFQVERVKNR